VSGTAPAEITAQVVARFEATRDPRLRELGRETGLGAGLSDLGLREEDLDLAAGLAAAGAPDVPAPTGEAEVREMLANAMGKGVSAHG
jgi:hypothetical protein